MQWKVSSSLAVITPFLLSVLLFASDLVVAQISAPFCTDITSSWGWAYNSLDQSPCTVTAYLMSTCYFGVFNMNPLGPGDTAYAGPSITEVIDANACWCNTVIYNLISACSECQGRQPLYWYDYYRNCSTILAPATFPNPVPAGTRVQHWALLDIPTVEYWSPITAQRVGDTPEVLPGGIINTPAIVPTPSTVTPYTTPSHTFVPGPTLTPTFPSLPTSGLSNRGALNTNPFAGGVTTVAAMAGLILSLVS
jgi:hypothetical protein